MLRMESIPENVSLPDEEEAGLKASRLCIGVKYNTAVPNFSENILLPEETGSQGKSELCIQISKQCLKTYSSMIIGVEFQIPKHLLYAGNNITA